MSERFSGKVALVAGGTVGLGRAVSLLFCGEGAQVAVTYRKQEELDALKQAARSNDCRLSGYVTDVTDETALGGENSATRSPPPSMRLNSVLPSIIDTEANRKAMPKSDFAMAETRRHRTRHPVPLQRRRQGHPRRCHSGLRG